MKKIFLTILSIFLFQSNLMAQNNLENLIYMDLKDGRVTIETFPEVAPKHVARIKELVDLSLIHI